MTHKEKKDLAKFVTQKLKKVFANADIELNYNKNDPWQLLVVVSLSAQTTDKKVNEVSPALFNKFTNVYDFASAEPKQVEPYIKTLGLYKNKAKNLVLAAKSVVKDYQGNIPQKRDELEKLAGVGKKTSAVIVSNAFATPALAVDTHVKRVATRLGLTKQKDPNKIEDELTKLFDKDDLLFMHHAIIFHGRRICFAKKPNCSSCPLKERCPQLGVLNKQSIT